MSTFAKIMVVVNFVLAFAFLAAAGTLHGAAESWKHQHTALKTKFDTDVATLEKQVANKQTEADDARKEAASFRADRDAAQASQKQLNESNGVLMRELETKNGEIASLIAANKENATAVQDQSKRNDDLTNKLSSSEAERKQTIEKNNTLEENLARETARADNAEKGTAAAEATNKSLTEKLDAANTEITALKVHGGKLPAGDTITEPVKGVVQAASARDDVYVISVGLKDKVKVGYEFTVSRGNHYVSTIVIDSVFPNHAAGHTKAGMKKMDIQAGDAVATATGL